jgi:hypothetical protein
MSEQLRGRWASQRIPFGEGKLSRGTLLVMTEGSWTLKLAPW